MGWEEVWRVAMKHFAAEPVELRILIGLAVVFCALMILVGLKHAFRPAGPVVEPRQPDYHPSPKAVVTPTAAMAPAIAKVQEPKHAPLRLRASPVRAPRKAVKRTIKPFAPPRPKIQRLQEATRKPRYTEEHAPYSPLPPHG